MFLLEELFLFSGPLEGLHVLISRKRGGSGLVGGLNSVGGVLDVPLDGDGATAARNLDHVVGVVGDSHELRKGGVAKDAVVGQANVGDVEVDLLSAVVAWRAEGDSEPHLPKGRDGAAGDPGEGPGRHEPVVWNLEHLKGVDGDDVQACTPIDEGLADSNVVDGGGAHQRECANCLGRPGVVFVVESDGVLRPLEGLGRLNSRKSRVELASELLALVI